MKSVTVKFDEGERLLLRPLEIVGKNLARVHVCVCVRASMYLPVEKAHFSVKFSEVSLTPERSRTRAAGYPWRGVPKVGPANCPSGFMSPCACSAGEGPGDHQVLPAAVQAGRLGVGAELRHRRAQQPLVTAALHRECQLCPHVSQTYLFPCSFLLPCPSSARSHKHHLSLSLSLSLFPKLFICLLFRFYLNSLFIWEGPNYFCTEH